MIRCTRYILDIDQRISTYNPTSIVSSFGTALEQYNLPRLISNNVTTQSHLYCPGGRLCNGHTSTRGIFKVNGKRVPVKFCNYQGVIIHYSIYSHRILRCSISVYMVLETVCHIKQSVIRTGNIAVLAFCAPKIDMDATGCFDSTLTIILIGIGDHIPSDAAVNDIVTSHADQQVVAIHAIKDIASRITNQDVRAHRSVDILDF